MQEKAAGEASLVLAERGATQIPAAQVLEQLLPIPSVPPPVSRRAPAPQVPGVTLGVPAPQR